MQVQGKESCRTKRARRPGVCKMEEGFDKAAKITDEADSLVIQDAATSKIENDCADGYLN